MIKTVKTPMDPLPVAVERDTQKSVTHNVKVKLSIKLPTTCNLPYSGKF